MPDPFPCSVCKKHVSGDSVYCNECNQWSHKSCNLLTKNEFQQLNDEPEEKLFYCVKCLNAKIPFSKLTEVDFYSLIKCGTILEASLLDKSDLKILESQEYLKKLNNYLSQLSSPLKTILMITFHL